MSRRNFYRRHGLALSAFVASVSIAVAAHAQPVEDIDSSPEGDRASGRDDRPSAPDDAARAPGEDAIERDEAAENDAESGAEAGEEGDDGLQGEDGEEEYGDDEYDDDDDDDDELPLPNAANEAIDVSSEDDLDRAEPGRPTERKLGVRDVARMPGAFGDAFRAIEALPGVAPMATGLPHLFVRGATPSASGYFIDGIKVPFLFHLGVGPSVLNPALIGDVTFYPGAYPAEFGRHTGGIVSATTRPSSERIRAEGTIRLFDAGAYVEVPITPIDTSVFGGFRYSYLAPLLSLAAPDTKLEYWDYLGGAWYHISSRERVGVLAFGSSDFLGSIEGETETELFGAEFHRANVRYELAPHGKYDALDSPRGTSASIGFTFGTDRSGLSDQASTSARNYQLSNKVDVPIADWLRLRGGLDLLAEEIDFVALSDPITDDDKDDGEFDFDIREAFASRDAGTVGAWIDLVFQPVEEVELVPGFRTDLFAEGSVTQTGVDPRGMIRLRPSRWLTTITAAGRMHQKPALLVQVPGLTPTGLDRGLQKATQLSQGFEFGMPQTFTFGAAGFYHIYEDLTDLTATCTADVKQCSINNRADGRAFGLELMLQRPLSHEVGGLVSYTLARSERDVRGNNFVADFDRTHVFNAAVGVDFGGGYHGGARITVLSGRPHSLIRFDNPEEPQEPTMIGKRNSLRRAAFHRLDLRFEKRWVIADVAWISLIVEGFNVTLQKEIIDFDCRVADVLGAEAGLSCGGQEIGPISIPSIGVSGGL